jgi:hypothetical protein
MTDQATCRSTGDHEPDRDAGNCDAGQGTSQADARPADEEAGDSVDAALDRLRAAAIRHERS